MTAAQVRTWRLRRAGQAAEKRGGPSRRRNEPDHRPSLFFRQSSASSARCLADPPGTEHVHDRGAGVHGGDGRHRHQPGLRLYQAGLQALRLTAAAAADGRALRGTVPSGARPARRIARNQRESNVSEPGPDLQLEHASELSADASAPDAEGTAGGRPTVLASLGGRRLTATDEQTSTAGGRRRGGRRRRDVADGRRRGSPRRGGRRCGGRRGGRRGRAEVDPVEAFRRELRAMPGDWYVIHSYAGYENRVKSNLESRSSRSTWRTTSSRSRSPRRGDRDQERQAQEGPGEDAARLRPGPDGPDRRVLGRRPQHSRRHRLRRTVDRPSPLAWTRSPRCSRP